MAVSLGLVLAGGVSEMPAGASTSTVQTDTKDASLQDGGTFGELYSEVHGAHRGGFTHVAAPQAVNDGWKSLARQKAETLFPIWEVAMVEAAPIRVLSTDNGQSTVVVEMFVNSAPGSIRKLDPLVSVVDFVFKTKGNGSVPPATGDFSYADGTLVDVVNLPSKAGLYIGHAKAKPGPSGTTVPDGDIQWIFEKQAPWMDKWLSLGACGAATYLATVFGKVTSYWISQVPKDDVNWKSKFWVITNRNAMASVMLGFACAIIGWKLLN